MLSRLAILALLFTSVNAQCDCYKASEKCEFNGVCFGYIDAANKVCTPGANYVCAEEPEPPTPVEPCVCESENPCAHKSLGDNRCLALNSQGKCPAGTASVCPKDPEPAPVEPCACGSDTPCIHNTGGDNSCAALNEDGKCPNGFSSTCSCFNTGKNSLFDEGCTDSTKKVCVLNGVEPAAGMGGNECVRCVNTPTNGGSVARGCWLRRPICVAEPDMAGDMCISEAA